MDHKHFKILEFLKNRDWTHYNDFPNSITSDFLKYGMSEGTLRFELQITLANADWLESNPYANDKYKISGNGILAFNAENANRVRVDKIKGLEEDNIELQNEMLKFQTNNKQLDLELKEAQRKLVLAQTHELKWKKIWGIAGFVGGIMAGFFLEMLLKKMFG